MTEEERKAALEAMMGNAAAHDTHRSERSIFFFEAMMGKGWRTCREWSRYERRAFLLMLTILLSRITQ
jgi:hypothetical protein